MARQPSIQDEEILEAAREVFLAHGILATTADVAEKAGISEALVFKRFRTKERLFRRAMEEGLSLFPWGPKLAARVGQGDMKQNVCELGRDAIGYVRTIWPLVMMSWSNPGPSGVPEIFMDSDAPPLRVLKDLSGYFEAEIRLGRIRRQDPEIVARTIMGAVFHYVCFEQVFRAQELLPLPEETFVRGLVELVWPGLAPRP